MANNIRVNDLSTMESTKPSLKGRNEPKSLGNKRPYRDHRDEKDRGRGLGYAGLNFCTYALLIVPRETLLIQVKNQHIIR